MSGLAETRSCLDGHDPNACPMSEANCLIVLEHERGKVEAGEPVAVQLFEGLA
jgi:hypothetical protein